MSDVISRSLSKPKATLLNSITTDLVESGVKEGPALYRRILEIIRPKRHPLHNIVNWNDAEAAESFRIEQIRYHVKALKITVDIVLDTSHSIELKSVNSIFATDGGMTRQFYTIDELKRKNLISDTVKAQIISDAMAFVKKYDRYTKVFGGRLSAIIVAINKFIAQSRPIRKLKRKRRHP